MRAIGAFLTGVAMVWVLAGGVGPAQEKGKGKTEEKEKGKGKTDDKGDKGKGRGKEIADKAKGAKLNKGREATAKKDGKRVTFTPADLGKLKSEKDLEGGQVVGHLDTELPGDESGLPPGKYNLLLAKEGGKWVVHAESGGQVAGTAKDVKVDKHGVGKGQKGKRPDKPKFGEKGWYWEETYVVYYEEVTVEVVYYEYTVVTYW
jgi:hypothetical protein